MDARMMRSSMAIPSVVVACAGLLDVGLDQEALLGDIARPRLEPAQHLGVLAVPLAPLQHPRGLARAAPPPPLWPEARGSRVGILPPALLSPVAARMSTSWPTASRS